MAIANAAPIQVMLADDSIVMRRLLAETLNADPDLNVVYAARHGRDLLDHLGAHAPDVVLLDVEMPQLDGLQTLAAIRKAQPRLPVIMFSSTTVKGGEATLEALSLGASDYVAKPSGVGNVQHAIQQVRDQVIPKLKVFGGRVRVGVAPGGPPSAAGRTIDRAARAAKRTAPARLDVVAIGVSTGGPNALATLLPQLAPDLEVPVLIVQHMPPVFTRLLAERLNAASRLPVREAADGDIATPGTIWIAPGDYHLVVDSCSAQIQLRLNQKPHENSCRPAVDVLFRSVAEHFGDHVLAVVLTGMGNDGLAGCREIQKRGGMILTQDQASCVVWGMPRAVTEAGLADQELPLMQLGDEINRLVPRAKRPLLQKAL